MLIMLVVGINLQEVFMNPNLADKQPNHWKRNAGFYLAGQFVSMFGSMLVSQAVMWHVTLEQQSGSLLALFSAATMLPMVFISPFAGVWADRYNRKYLVNIADTAIAIVTLAVALLFSAGFQSVWLLLAVGMARSIGMGIQGPAASALIPQIVPEAELTRFNGIQGTAQSIVMFAAPMAAGALLTFLPIQAIFYIDIVTAIIGISTVFFCVRVPHVPRKEAIEQGGKAYYNEMMAGFRYIVGQPWLKTMVIASSFFVVLVAPAALLTPLQVARTFGDDVWRLTAIEIAFSVGMMAGGILIAVWGGFKNKSRTMVLAWVIFGITTVLFGVVPNFWVYLGVMLLCGGAMPLYNTPSMTLVQTKIPPELMGRTMSVIMMINGIGMPLGMAIFGPLGDIVRIELLLVITGILMAAGGLLLRTRREFMEAGVPAPKLEP
jgi:DHA3 family macrolide efflux protein-like MFS transporter